MGDPIDHTQQADLVRPLPTSTQSPAPSPLPGVCTISQSHSTPELPVGALILHNPPGALLMRGHGPQIREGTLELCVL